MTFRERYMRGEASFDEIFALADEWNFSDETCTLRAYLGLTEEEEDVWISESDEALEDLMEREKNRWIFFADLDGTLLNDQKEIGAHTREVIDQIRSLGHAVVISTGRTLYSALRQAKRLGLIGKNCYIICYNGCQIYDTDTHKLLKSSSIPMDLIRTAFSCAAQFPIYIQTYQDQYVITQFDGAVLEKYCRIQGIEGKVVPDVCAILKDEPPKMLVIEDDLEKVGAFRDLLQEKADGRLDLFMSQKDYMEIVPAGVNKGAAVRFLCDYLGVPIEHTIGAGDMENDLTMIDAVGIGVVMCNGVEELKKHADYITKADNNHDGAVEAVEKFILNRN